MQQHVASGLAINKTQGSTAVPLGCCARQSRGGVEQRHPPSNAYETARRVVNLLYVPNAYTYDFIPYDSSRRRKYGMLVHDAVHDGAQLHTRRAPRVVRVGPSATTSIPTRRRI